MSARRTDRPTIALFLLYVALLATGVLAASSGRLPLPAAFAVGLVAFNLSFTIWHECVHGTAASDPRLRAAIGWITAWLMIYPGYFLQRREHLLHHKHQGDPQRDPVHPRVQCAPWAFPLHLALTSLRDPQPPNPEAVLSPGERRADRAGYLLFLAIAAGLTLSGHGAALLAAWIAPRLAMAPVHAFYVCYLPHHPRGAELYQVYRVVLRNPFTRYLTLYHSYHGLHHVWPGIPWHRYRETFRARRAELEARGVEILGDA